jgi:uncharacterized protein with ParB-like and HNH nuclease domain
MKATETSVLKFIGGLDKAFIIPPYQRNYQWGKPQCEELFDDILTAYRTGKPHYLGNVVYYEGEADGASFNEYVLVDGQQRVTTILILLCALRDSMTEPDKQRRITERYLQNDTEDKRFRIRLKQTDYDDESFSDLMDGKAPNPRSNVAANYAYFLKRIKNCGIDPTHIYETIPRLEIVEVNLQTGGDITRVQTIFEKINHTGKSLSQTDLIRNFLLTTPKVAEQNKWYKQYWRKIEECLDVEDIDDFARDFLRMKHCEEVRTSDVYKEFKDYVQEDANKNKEAVLSELLKLARLYERFYYTDNEDDEVLCRRVHMLRNLNCDDFMPLLLYLYSKLYDEKKDSLRKAVTVLFDYLLRLRIASQQTGSGTTRAVAFSITKKMAAGEIPIDADAVLFELSNTPTPNGEFPSDEAFKEGLCDGFYYPYARELFLRIEESETHNIPVDISKVTVEHLMPQTHSSWWKENLGGEEEAERIRLNWLNTVGNLTIVSGAYNSALSNKPWPNKCTALKNVQFSVTSALPDEYPHWSEQQIQERGENLAVRACAATTCPIPRSVEYSSRSGKAIDTGRFPLQWDDESLNGASIRAVIYDGERYECGYWKRLDPVICGILYALNPAGFEAIIAQHEWLSAEPVPGYESIPNTSFFCKGSPISGIAARNQAAAYCEELGLAPEAFELEVEGG